MSHHSFNNGLLMLAKEGRKHAGVCHFTELRKMDRVWLASRQSPTFSPDQSKALT